MAIQRSGPTPAFYDYIITKALVPFYSSSVQQIANLGVSEWLYIPRYQRGITWNLENVKEFLILDQY